jgi:STE24 endopeptidase
VVVVVVLAGVLLLGAVGVLGLRRWSVRVERGPGDVPDKVHRLQRASLAGVLAVAFLPWLALLPLQLEHHAHPVRQHAHTPLGAAMVLAPLLFLMLIFGVMKAVRPSLVRLRGIDGKSPLRWRTPLALAPIGLAFGLLYAGLRALVPGRGGGYALGVLVAYVLALVVAQALLAPLWLLALHARRLESAEQARLEDLARRLGVRVGGFRCFPGRSQKVGNAVQVGLLPRLRYILITDYLLDHLEPAEVDAVVAHELGHARGHHLAVKLAGVVAVWAALSGGFAVLPRSRHSAGLLPLIPAALPFALLLVQGVIGVRLERRADAAAARDVGADELASALDKIATLNDTKRRTGGLWNLITQHPGTQERIDTLRSQATRADAPA